MIRFALTMLLLVLLSIPAAAHQTGQATFVAHLKPETRQVDTLLACPMPDVAHAAQVDEPRAAWNRLGFYLDQHIRVTNNGEVCQPIEKRLSPPDNAFWFLKAVQCDGELGRVVIHNDAMTETKGGYSYVGRVQLGDAVQTTVFSAATPTYTIDVGSPSSQSEEVSMGSFVLQGIAHILGGLDHVLFVFALILMSRRLRDLLIVVTGFTIAHSITLALAALDVVNISPNIIEPLIALSIVWAAVEAGLQAESHKRAYLATFLLGLVHGFGFAYVLRAEVGLPQDALVPALLSFNVGVELGQLGVVGLLYPLRRLIRDRPWERRVVVATAALIGAVALFWFFERLYFA